MGYAEGLDVRGCGSFHVWFLCFETGILGFYRKMGKTVVLCVLVWQLQTNFTWIWLFLGRIHKERMKLPIQEVNWGKYLFLKENHVIHRLLDELESRMLEFFGLVADWMWFAINRMYFSWKQCAKKWTKMTFYRDFNKILALAGLFGIYGAADVTVMWYFVVKWRVVSGFPSHRFWVEVVSNGGLWVAWVVDTHPSTCSDTANLLGVKVRWQSGVRYDL